jgi:hypothetical protein
MKTRTYADILAGQGEYAQAASIYRHLLKAAPSDGALRARLTELEHLAATAPAPERTRHDDRHELEPRPELPRIYRPHTAPRVPPGPRSVRRDALLALLDRIVRRRQRT